MKRYWPWTPAEDEVVRNAANPRAAVLALKAIHSHRTPGAVKQRYVRLGNRSAKPQWTPEEDAIISAAFTPREAHAALLAAGFSRTVGAITTRRVLLRVTHRARDLTGTSDGVAWAFRPTQNQPAAKRIHDWIEANSPMTLAQFEAGMREMEGRP